MESNNQTRGTRVENVDKGTSQRSALQSPHNDPHLHRMYRSLFAHSPTTHIPVLVPSSPLHHTAAYNRLESPADLHQQHMSQKSGADSDHTSPPPPPLPVRRRRTQLTLQPPRRRLQKAIQQSEDLGETGTLPGASTSTSIRTLNSDQAKAEDGVMDTVLSPTNSNRRHSFMGLTPLTPSTLFGYHHMKFQESSGFSPLPSSGRHFSPMSPVPMSPSSMMASSPGFFQMSPTGSRPQSSSGSAQQQGTLYTGYPTSSHYASSPYGFYTFHPFHCHQAYGRRYSGYVLSPGFNSTATASNSNTQAHQAEDSPAAVNFGRLTASTQASTAASSRAAAKPGEAATEEKKQDTIQTGKTRKRRKRDAGKMSHAGKCGNCASTDTPMWRRSKFNKDVILCNKCGLYEARTGRSRPMLKRKPIKRRKTVEQQEQNVPEQAPPPPPPPQQQQQSKVQPVTQPTSHLNPVLTMLADAASLDEALSVAEGISAEHSVNGLDVVQTAPSSKLPLSNAVLPDLQVPTSVQKEMLPKENVEDQHQKQSLEPAVLQNQTFPSSIS